MKGKKRVLFAFTWSEIDRFTFQVVFFLHLQISGIISHNRSSSSLLALHLSSAGQQVWNSCSRLKAGILHPLSLPLKAHFETPERQPSLLHEQQGRSLLHPAAGRHAKSADLVSFQTFSPIEPLDCFKCPYFLRLALCFSARQLHREAYICDMTHLRQRLRCYNLTGSASDCSNVETDTAWNKDGAEEERSPLSGHTIQNWSVIWAFFWHC